MSAGVRCATRTRTRWWMRKRLQATEYGKAEFIIGISFTTLYNSIQAITPVADRPRIVLRNSDHDSHLHVQRLKIHRRE
ncbi:MAG: hypothetical protein K2X86_12430, partial [Cytophagaceae bacterium]|nr:hypothetical protein [Cytophagaceae bacterium]